MSTGLLERQAPLLSLPLLYTILGASSCKKSRSPASYQRKARLASSLHDPNFLIIHDAIQRLDHLSPLERGAQKNLCKWRALNFCEALKPTPGLASPLLEPYLLQRIATSWAMKE